MEQRIADAEKHLQTHGNTLSAYAQQIAAHEKLVNDHGARLTNHSEVIIGHAQRIQAIEIARQARKEEEIRREEQQKARDAHIDTKLGLIEATQKESKATLQWLFRTVVAAVAAAVITFLLKGGLVL